MRNKTVKLHNKYVNYPHKYDKCVFEEDLKLLNTIEAKI